MTFIFTWWWLSKIFLLVKILYFLNIIYLFLYIFYYFLVLKIGNKTIIIFKIYIFIYLTNHKNKNCL